MPQVCAKTWQFSGGILAKPRQAFRAQIQRDFRCRNNQSSVFGPPQQGKAIYANCFQMAPNGTPIKRPPIKAKPPQFGLFPNREQTVFAKSGHLQAAQGGIVRYKTGLPVLKSRHRQRRTNGQFTFRRGENGSGITGTPSSISFFASAIRASP